MEGVINKLFATNETKLSYEEYMKALNICIAYEVQNDVEVWREIPNYPKHRASNFGRIKSCVFRKPKILIPTLKGNHLYVSISENGNRKHLRLDYLIASTYIINPNASKLVAHVDNDNKNCSPLNLDWK